MMLVGGLGLPISVISALMFLAGSYGTQNAALGEACLILLGPLGLVLTGLGLWRRWRWAWWAALVTLAGVASYQVGALIQGPRATQTYTTPSGTLVTVMGSGKKASAWPVLVGCAALGAWLLSKRVREEFRGERLERREGEVVRDWRSETVAPTHASGTSALPKLPATPPPWQQRAALGLVILFLVGVAVGMGWLVQRGIDKQQTVMPSKSARHRRVLKRQDEPASYWAALGLYSLVGLASAGGAGWMLREAWRMRSR